MQKILEWMIAGILEFKLFLIAPLGFFYSEVGTYRLTRNVGKKLPLLAA
jgi:hypothetical protein